MRLTTYGALTILASLALADSLPRGVAPADAKKYLPIDGKWSCLNHPEIVLNWEQVNDDYCDCPDGSDEPGTSACANGKFWCMNEGHVGQFIPSSLVGDGVCDYDVCCDGSDEAGVVNCINRCEKMHTEAEFYRKEAERDRRVAVDKTAKTQRAAKRLRSKLEEKLKVSEALLGFHDRELKRFAKIAEERQEKEDKAYGPKMRELKKIKDETKDKIFNQFNLLINTEKSLTSLKTLGDKLIETFNENLNDVAVKKTVEDLQNHFSVNKRSYAQWPDFETVQKNVVAKLQGDIPHIYESFETVTKEVSNAFNKNGKMKIRIADLERYLSHLSDNYNPNFNDPNVKEVVNSFKDYISNKQEDEELEDVKSISSIFEEITDKFNEARSSIKPEIKAPLKSSKGKGLFDTLFSKAHFMWNDFLGIGPPRRLKMPEPENDEEHASVIAELESERSIERESVSSIKLELDKNYGPYDIYRAMDGVMATSHIGDYDYEMEFIGEIRQKGENGHNVLIGKFDHVDAMEDEEGVIVYYENGHKCWNGPHRRAIVKVECGAEHHVLGVTEPEKCEYHFRMKSPLGCVINENDKISI